ncbi:hypothetical protein [Bacillus sp. 03113]|uniref:hypothetical protein n=1 Tax=Bacillus sp. 03113 TaxID=2578211 RepID=UPI0011451111|nr:hypothetical protein [Bacillus sp. 03113]
MVDVFEVANILVENIKKKYRDDIALVAYYGSYAQGRATTLSDLDMFFIPSTKKGFAASFQFILDGIGYDLFPISWDRALRMASFDESTVSVIANSKILYVKSEEDLSRFNQLKNKISSMEKTESKKLMIEKASNKLNECYIHLYKMNMPETRDNLSAIRNEAYGTITKIFESLALINQTYLKRWWGASLEQIYTFRIKPHNLEELIKTIIRSQSCEKIIRTCDELFNKVRLLLIVEQKNIVQVPIFSSFFNGFYEEEKSIFNKIISACDREDYEGAFFATIHIQNELMNFFNYAKTGVWYNNLHSYDMLNMEYQQLGLPELISIVQSGNLKLLKKTVIELDRILKSLLKSRGVNLKIFDTLEEFRIYIEDES